VQAYAALPQDLVGYFLASEEHNVENLHRRSRSTESSFPPPAARSEIVTNLLTSRPSEPKSVVVSKLGISEPLAGLLQQFVHSRWHLARKVEFTRATWLDQTICDDPTVCE
jgi:hypothetical protein